MSIELVQFKIIYYGVGNKIDRYNHEDFFVNCPLFIGLLEGKEVQDVLTLQPKDSNRELGEDGFLRTLDDSGHEVWVVQHTFINFEPTRYVADCADFSGMESEVESTSAVDVFKDHLPDILGLAEKYGWNYRDRTIGSEGDKTISVVTVWDWEFTYDDDGGDSSFDLLGAVPIGRIRPYISV